MAYEYDIIITYASKDDEPLKPNSPGWVSNFKQFLEVALKQIRRQEVKVGLICEYDSALLKKKPNANILFSIISPDYFLDKSLAGYVRKFVNGLEVSEAKQIKSRYFKIIKFPTGMEGDLPQDERTTKFDFYLTDHLTYAPKEFTDFFGPQAEKNFWMTFIDLAFQIHQVMNGRTESIGTRRKDDLYDRSKTVYLASVSNDIKLAYDIIKRELVSHGFRVLPDRSLPTEVNALQTSLKRYLDQCGSSIHLVGHEYGEKPKGTDLSMVELQNTVAAEYCANINGNEQSDQSFNRLIWLPGTGEGMSERQKIFIDDLKSDIHIHDSAQLLEISLQEFKTLVIDLLSASSAEPRKNGLLSKEEKAGNGTLIYVICNKLDQNAVKQLVSHLKQLKFRVVVSPNEGNLADLRYLHQQNLKRCDATIIYAKLANQEWVITKLKDVLKAPGFGRKRPLLGSLAYMVGEHKLKEDIFTRHQTMLVGNQEDFKADLIQPFVSKLKP